MGSPLSDGRLCVRTQLRPAIVSLAAAHVDHRRGLSAGGDRLAQALFPHQANGSLIVRDGQAVGSELIGQPFDDPKYFWGRLSATAPFPYNAAASSGSNLGPLNPDLVEAAQARIDALRAADPATPRPSRWTW